MVKENDAFYSVVQNSCYQEVRRKIEKDEKFQPK